MTWAQYWSMQWKTFEVNMSIYAVLLILAAIGFVGFVLYDKVQDWRGK